MIYSLLYLEKIRKINEERLLLWFRFLGLQGLMIRKKC